jgi:hypothetical protein
MMGLLNVDEEALKVVLPLWQKARPIRKLAARQLEGELHGIAEEVVELRKIKRQFDWPLLNFF